MDQPIADQLLVVLADRQPLSAAANAGTLERRWLVPAALSKSYRATTIVGPHGPEEADIARALGARYLPTDGQTIADADLQRLFHGCGSAVIRTEEFSAGPTACRLALRARVDIPRVALVARGGWLWSRFAARAHGPDSSAAENAARVEADLCLQAHAVIGATDAMVGDLSWRYRVPAERTHVVADALPPDLPMIEAETRKPDLVVYAGELDSTRRVELLLKAAVVLAEQAREQGNNPPRWVFVGDGPRREALHQHAQSLGLGENARFVVPGGAGDVMDWTCQAAVFVVASSMEQLPMNLLEAMATGTAVVVANAPGLARVVQHGVTGLVMPPEPEAFARAIEGLLGDEGWRQAMGGAAAREVRAAYAVEHIAQLELGVHRAALGRADHALKADAAQRSNAA